MTPDDRTAKPVDVIGNPITPLTPEIEQARKDAPVPSRPEGAPDTKTKE
ncbi:hypothetical protein [Falsirhodobacter algicola]|uniref:Uncharacterized protein n=1 Tax=Falsirhodobacter algicola TaxID=2692330 RepID=A0A8J8MSV9_9RHOB|nr:hypothetical protein [Falsirhodobacter algicola]QUS35643.1 hypothetical protein GR316_04775 [Falsirhodobacter algicola]